MNFFKKCYEVFAQLCVWVLRVLPTDVGMLIRRWAYSLLMKKAGNIQIAENVTITGFNNIEIGDYTSIMSNSCLYAHDSTLGIGENCSFNNNVQISAAHGQIHIGNDVIIGANTIIRAGTHRYERTNVPIRKQGHKRGKIIIEDDVWISSNVVITADVTLGKGSVVGAGAVVTKNVPAYVFVAGVPAEVIRTRKRNIVSGG